MLNQLYFYGIIKVNYNDSTFKMKCYNKRGFTIENRLFWLGSGNNNLWEKQSNTLWSTLAKNSEVVFDIGANTGYYSLLAKANNPRSKVFGFEPVEHIFKWYKSNCDLNQFDVKCYNLALSDRVGQQYIYRSNTPQNIYSASLDYQFAKSHSKRAVEPVAIETITLKNFIKTNNVNRIDLMKVDVEGYELKVLEGMGKYLALYKPSMIIEVLTAELAEELTTVLIPLNYLFYNLNKGERPTLSHKITVSGEYNYLFCQKNVAKTIGLKC